MRNGLSPPSVRVASLAASGGYQCGAKGCVEDSSTSGVAGMGCRAATCAEDAAGACLAACSSVLELLAFGVLQHLAGKYQRQRKTKGQCTASTCFALIELECLLLQLAHCGRLPRSPPFVRSMSAGMAPCSHGKWHMSTGTPMDTGRSAPP